MIIMKYFNIFLVACFLLAAGCLETSSYREVSPQQLMADASFEGKYICINGVIENGSISGIPVSGSRNFTGDIKEWTLSKACGTYRSGSLEVDIVNATLSISSEKNVYQSNETLRIHTYFISPVEGKGQVRVSGINNDFGRPLIDETREESLIIGKNSFDFEFTTPSCEECSALRPGVYYLNASITFDKKSFETYKKIRLEKEESNISDNTPEKIEVNNTPIPAQEENVAQDNAVIVEYFYIPGCQKCEKATPVIEKLMRSYGSNVNFIKYNANEEGRNLAIKYQIPGTPAVIINKDKDRLISYADYNGDTGKLETVLKAAIENAAAPVAAVQSGTKIVLSIPSVLVVGLLAGFNPCLLAILAFIASVALATTGRRRNVLLIVLMFSLGIFTTYLIFGIGLLRIFEQSPGLQVTIKNFLVILIGVLGIWHIYDAYHMTKNRESSFYTPKSFIRLTESMTKKVSLPASFFMGALFSLIKAPCVGAVYFVILDMVRSGEGAGYMYLAAYNFGVVLPVLVLGSAIAFGLDPEKVEKFRKDKRSAMRLITGVTLLAIALLMYAGMI